MTGLFGGYEQQAQNYWVNTTTATTGTYSQNYLLGEWPVQRPVMPTPQEPEEIAWLKRRVKEIEWRA